MILELDKSGTVLTIVYKGYPRIQMHLPDARALRKRLNDHKRELRPSKDWDNCPYEGHHDTCDCRGMGGDR